MPRYFLHLRVDARLIEDPDGSLLANLEEAHLEAVHGAKDILAEQLRCGVQRWLGLSEQLLGHG